MTMLFFKILKQKKVRQRLLAVKMEFSRLMPGVTSVAVGGYGCWMRVVGLGAEISWVSSSDEAPEAALSDTSRSQVAGPPAKCLSAWGQTA